MFFEMASLGCGLLISLILLAALPLEFISSSSPPVCHEETRKGKRGEGEAFLLKSSWVSLTQNKRIKNT
jgi:hypothetical protein